MDFDSKYPLFHKISTFFKVSRFSIEFNPKFKKDFLSSVIWPISKSGPWKWLMSDKIPNVRHLIIFRLTDNRPWSSCFGLVIPRYKQNGVKKIFFISIARHSSRYRPRRLRKNFLKFYFGQNKRIWYSEIPSSNLHFSNVFRIHSNQSWNFLEFIFFWAKSELLKVNSTNAILLCKPKFTFFSFLAPFEPFLSF